MARSVATEVWWVHDTNESVSIVVRPVGSPDELTHVLGLISAQLPPRRSAPARGPKELKYRLDVDRTLMLVAEVDEEIVGGAVGSRTADVVKVDVIPLIPEARRLGIAANSQNRGF